ncbi:MAG: insulinase family protein [Myxococcota bacterium]
MTSLLALTLLGGGPTAQAGETIQAPQDMRPQLPQGFTMDSRSFQFPSGLRVIMQPDHSAPIVAITTYIDHGSTSDPQGKEGIAHFLEHLWFKSRHIDDSQVKTWDVLEDLGCNLNASTSMDWTNYMSVCPKAALPTLMRFASLRLTNTINGVRPEEVDSEREVIRNELRMRGQMEGRAIYQYALESLFTGDHPYGRLGIGSHDTLDSITLEDIRDFAAKSYRPNESTIVVVGDFEPEEAGSLIVENFDLSLLHPDLTEDHVRFAPRPGVAIDEVDPQNPDRDQVYFVAMDPANPRLPLDIEGDPVVRSASFGRPPGDPVTREVATYEAAVNNQIAVVAWSLPSGFQGQDVVGNVAAGQIAGQLFRQFYSEFDVVKDELKRPQVGCWYLPFQENSMMLCYTEVKRGRPAARWTEKMLDQLVEVTNPESFGNPIVRQAIERDFGTSRNGAIRDTLNSMDRVSGLTAARATQLGEYAHHTGDHQYYSSAMNSFGRLDMAPVLEMVQQFATRERAARFVLKPLPKDELVLDSSESEYHGASADDDQIVSMLTDDQITADLIREQVVTPDFDKVIDRKLPNGMRVVVYPHGEAPLASIRLVSQGGRSSDVRGTDSTIDLLASEGFDVNLDPLRIAARWRDGGRGTFTWLGMDAPAGNTGDALWYLRKRLEGIRPDFDGKGTYIKRQKSRMLGRWQSDDYWQSRLTSEALGPIDHPAFGVSRYEDLEWAKRLKKRDVLDYIARKYHPQNMMLVAVGSFDADEVYSAAEKYFGSWSTEAESFEPMPSPGKAEIPSHEPLYLLVDQERRPQTEVTAYCRLADSGPEGRADRRVLSTMLNGTVFQELRVKEGVSYSPGGSIQSRVGDTNVLTMRGLVQNDAVALTTNVFHKIVEDGANGVFPMNRFRPSQLSLSRKPVLGLQAIADVANNFASALGDGWTYDQWRSYGDLLAGVTPEAMQALMEPCPDALVIQYDGPLKVIGPILKEAGIEFTVIDGKELALPLYDKYSPKDAKKLRKRMAEAAEAEASADNDELDSE